MALIRILVDGYSLLHNWPEVASGYARHSERAAHRFSDYGEVLVVTDDRTERDIVGGLGSSVAGCANFVKMVRHALTELQDKLHGHNRRERARFSCDPRAV